MNKLHIIGKQENQSWESWFSKRPPGTVVLVSWQWRNDPARKVMNGWAGNGFFTKSSARGMDTYTRTDKPYRSKKPKPQTI